MKSFILFLIFSLTLGVSANAQFKVKAEKLDSSKKYSGMKQNRSAFNVDSALDGKMIYLIPQFFVTEMKTLGFKQNIHKLSFQQIENECFLFAEYWSWGEIFDASTIDEVVFTFQNGEHVSYIPSTILERWAPMPAQTQWQIYTLRCKVSADELRRLCENQAVALSFCCSDKKYTTTISPKKSCTIVQAVTYFLDKKKLSEKEVANLFNQKTSKGTDTQEWDF